MNTFDALEFDALRILKHVTMVGIGPSIPSIFRDDNIFRDDMIEISSKNYMDWLNSKDKGSVIYIAFASYSEISSQLIEVFGHGLLECGRPFLWVIREGKDGEKMEEKLSCKDELEKQGKIMSWCSQLKVLKHPSIGCFLTHYGWN
uniref:Glycosyltransferase n=1 Tax=Solanum tuberosum TaxID=4113 RepID=M1DFY9_SOLTU